MEDLHFFYPGFCEKCITFSYDDGVIQDIPFIENIKNSGFKVTFNLNSGLFGQIKFRDGVDNSRLSEKEVKKIYANANFEVASHSLYHYHMENLSYYDNLYQIQEDTRRLSKIFQKEIRGFAYPFGTYDEDVLRALKDSDMLYARTTKSTYSFTLPEDFLMWNPTIHHSDPDLLPLIKDFKNSKEELALFYLWGHTYEFENKNAWNILSLLQTQIAHQESIAYMTNREVVEYISSRRKVHISSDEIWNDSDENIYISFKNQKIVVKPRQKIEIG